MSYRTFYLKELAGLLTGKVFLDAWVFLKHCESDGIHISIIVNYSMAFGKRCLISAEYPPNWSFNGFLKSAHRAARFLKRCAFSMKGSVPRHWKRPALGAEKT